MDSKEEHLECMIIHQKSQKSGMLFLFKLGKFIRRSFLGYRKANKEKMVKQTVYSDEDQIEIIHRIKKKLYNEGFIERAVKELEEMALLEESRMADLSKWELVRWYAASNSLSDWLRGSYWLRQMKKGPYPIISIKEQSEMDSAFSAKFVEGDTVGSVEKEVIDKQSGMLPVIKTVFFDVMITENYKKNTGNYQKLIEEIQELIKRNFKVGLLHFNHYETETGDDFHPDLASTIQDENVMMVTPSHTKLYSHHIIVRDASLLIHKQRLDLTVQTEQVFVVIDDEAIEEIQHWHSSNDFMTIQKHLSGYFNEKGVFYSENADVKRALQESDQTGIEQIQFSNKIWSVKESIMAIERMKRIHE